MFRGGTPLRGMPPRGMFHRGISPAEHSGPRRLEDGGDVLDKGPIRASRHG